MQSVWSLKETKKVTLPDYLNELLKREKVIEKMKAQDLKYVPYTFI